MTRTWKSAPALTAEQRRRKIIDLLAGHLARMPRALDMMPARPGSPHDGKHELTPQNLRESSRIGLEVYAN